MEKVTLNTIAKWMRAKNSLTGSFNKIAINSKEIAQGDLFIALKGEKVDGHTFLKEALDRGAVAAVVSKTDPDSNLPQILVDDTLMALQMAAKRRIEIESPKIIGVTGSVGKTMTKEFITTLLKEKFRVESTPKNYNTRITLPLTLLNINTPVDWLVLEMGMTHFGDIGKLVQIAPPDIGVITKVAYAHAENFSSLEEIAIGKAEIFSHPKTRIGIIPEDFPCKDSIVIPWTSPPVGEKRSGQFYLNGLSFGPYSLPGQHTCDNLATAITAARLVGLEDSEIARGIEKLQLPAMRMEFITKNGIDFINDSYNANCASMKALLQTASEYPHKRKIAVLGEMLELGQLCQEHHEEVGKFAAGKIDILYCYGEKSLPAYQEWKKRGLETYHFLDKSALGTQLKSRSNQGDLVLIKASNGNALWTLLENFN